MGVGTTAQVNPTFTLFQVCFRFGERNENNTAFQPILMPGVTLTSSPRTGFHHFDGSNIDFCCTKVVSCEREVTKKPPRRSTLNSRYFVGPAGALWPDRSRLLLIA